MNGLPLIAPWWLLLLVLYVILALPVMMLVGTVLSRASDPPDRPERVPCQICGYSMVAIDPFCPRCGAKVVP